MLWFPVGPWPGRLLAAGSGSYSCTWFLDYKESTILLGVVGVLLALFDILDLAGVVLGVGLVEEVAVGGLAEPQVCRF